MIPNLRPSVAPRRHAHVAGERHAKGVDRAVARALGNLCHAAIVAPKQVFRQRHAPGQQVFHGRHTQHAAEALKEGRA